MSGGNKTDIYEQYVERLHEAAVSGNMEMVEAALKVLPDVNAKNDKGWNALMFAARNGNAAISKLLLEKGCDKAAINSTGQTAVDIARFWNHAEVEQVLLGTDTEDENAGTSGFNQLSLQAQGFPQVTNYFCGNTLDRMAHMRKSKEWLDETLKKSSTKIILFNDLQPVVVGVPDQSQKGKRPGFRLFTAKYKEIEFIFEANPTLIFLGMETNPDNDESAPSQEGSAWFAVDASTMSEEKLKEVYPHAEVAGLYPTLMQLSRSEAAIFGQARTLLAWHDRYQFCPTCGSSTFLDEAGYKRKCSKEDCRSQKGIHNTSYPRLDPTVIMAVVSTDGKRLLLGRGKRFPRGMFSCLAGFMEPGESVEEACRREVMEEAGVRVGRVEYHSCQPWPMPCSLMLGCLAYATSDHVKVDKEELEEAVWFTRHEVIQLLNHKHPHNYYSPPDNAIAHQLIRTWVNMTSNL